VPDAADFCPSEAEDLDGVLDGDGCPDADLVARVPPPPAVDDDPDEDGVKGDMDRCPLAAEDRDGWEDRDGCPDWDNDLDGVADNVDDCPLAAETKNGFADADGCPDDSLAAVLGEVLAGATIAFEPGRPTLAPASGAVLDRVAEAIGRYAGVRVRVTVHGPDAALAGRRAEVVAAYLVGAGVRPERLDAAAIGLSNPEAATRVEFVLLSE
jgi:outer membrane protein OmpA-like peptidoglycan-associated protein